MFTEPRVGCGAAIIIDGRLLLLKRKKEPEAGCWGLAGGKIDLFETAPAAIEREVQEELGISITANDLLCFVDQIHREDGVHWVAPVYLVQSFKGEPRLMEPEKHEGPEWFALDALPSNLTTPTRFAVAAWRQRQKG